MDISLYFAPITCSIVAMTALEEAGLPFKAVPVSLKDGENYQESYLRVNPKAKVPTLVADGESLSETPAILRWLNAQVPEAQLLPHGSGIFGDEEILSDLNFVSALVHPIITRLCRPFTFCDVPGGEESVHRLAAEALKMHFARIDSRVAENGFWYGQKWSMMDAYLSWTWARAASTPFELAPYPHFQRLAEENGKRPSAQRAAARTAAAA
jgi:glutathione S-transferase